MGSDVEPAKKILLPYLQRADELQKHEPLVAYYCRLYAMERGLKIPAKERTKTTNAILVSLMNQLEKDKKTIQVSPDDNLYVEGFALNVFRKADKQDRAGRADISTAKTFYAASIFIEILHQFGPLQPDLEQKQKYAVWKAADIRKALSEGRKPVPGPPGGEEDLYASDSGGEAKTSFDTDSLKAPEQRPPAEQGSNVGPGISTPSLGNPVTFTPHAFQSDQRQHYSGTNVEHEVPHQGPDPGFSGYTSPYPGSFYPYPAAHDASVSPPDTHQYGSTTHLDSYNMPPYNHHDQSSLADGSVPTMPITYAGVNEVSDAVYYQPPGGHFQNAVVYPTSTVLNDSLRPSGAAPVVRPKDSTGLERTSSAPAATVETQAYQPTPQRIADAQKAARFAVSALAFDDVATAASYLRQSLDLLTNPAAVPHREG